jgi:hypothetical protein
MGLEKTPSLMEPKPFNPSLNNVKKMLERLKPLVRGLPGILIPNTVDVGIIRKNTPRFETSAKY